MPPTDDKSTDPSLPVNVLRLPDGSVIARSTVRAAMLQAFVDPQRVIAFKSTEVVEGDLDDATAERFDFEPGEQGNPDLVRCTIVGNSLGGHHFDGSIEMGRAITDIAKKYGLSRKALLASIAVAALRISVTDEDAPTVEPQPDARDIARRAFIRACEMFGVGDPSPELEDFDEWFDAEVKR